MTLEELQDSAYLGDGLYVGHDGFQVWLLTHNGIGVTNQVALEPDVLRSFKDWLGKSGLDQSD